MPYTRLYSVHPYWWKRQVLHQTWPSGSQHASKKECRQDIHSGFETHEEGHTKSKTGAISGSTKWTLVQTKILKKKKKKILKSYKLQLWSCFTRRYIKKTLKYKNIHQLQATDIDSSQLQQSISAFTCYALVVIQALLSNRWKMEGVSALFSLQVLKVLPKCWKWLKQPI